MNNQFDELTKSVALSVTWHAGVNKFDCGLAGFAGDQFSEHSAGQLCFVFGSPTPRRRTVCVFRTS